MPTRNGHPLIARGPLVAWDRESQARRAVAEEEGEIARMQAEAAAHTRALVEAAAHDRRQTEQTEEAGRDREATLVSLQQYQREIEILKRETAVLLARVEQQAELLAQWKAELDSLRRFSAIARGVMVDLISSRGYCLMRLLGRWKTLDKGIQRALR